MNLSIALRLAATSLKKAKINSPALDAEVLLAFTLKKPKEYLYIHPEAKIKTNQLKLFQKLIARRAKHEPVAYLTGHKEFYGLDFIVDKNTLIPRPETELMVDEAQKIAKNKKSFLIDIGTGSGCIPIAIVKNIDIKAIGIDNSGRALALAKKNARLNGIIDSRLRGNDKIREVKFIKNNLLENWELGIGNWEFIIITANLPYLPTLEWRETPPDVRKFEPRGALDGGRDGLKYYRKLLPQIRGLAPRPIYCLFEFCPEQKNTLKKLVLKYFPAAKIEIKKDLAGRDRLIIFNI